MKYTVRVALVLMLGFLGITALNFAGGWLDADDARSLLVSLQERPLLVGALVVGVLAVDSLLSVPTMATAAIAGHLLGPWWGSLSASIGVVVAGSICFGVARPFRTSAATERMRNEVGAVGPLPLLFSRALPMLPEVLSAMAGLAGMPFRRFLLWFALGNVPFVVAAAFAGSVSGIDRPWPAVFAAIGLPLLAASCYSMTILRTPK